MRFACNRRPGTPPLPGYESMMYGEYHDVFWLISMELNIRWSRQQPWRRPGVCRTPRVEHTVPLTAVQPD